jgi:hypothetical protein
MTVTPQIEETPVASSTEVALTFGGDWQTDPRGDLVLVQDTATAFPATIQRVIQIIFTNPRRFDQSGNPVGRADDLFNPSYGAGTDQDVGQLATAGLLADLVSRIQAGLALDAGIASSPVPIVTATNPSYGTVLVKVEVWTVTGQYVPVPTQTLQIFSS